MIYTEAERQDLEQGLQEYLSTDKLACSITYVAFLSYSKGRNRKRRYPKEIELIRYDNGYHYPHNFRWDDIATEVMPRGLDGLEADAMLRRMVPIVCRKGMMLKRLLHET